MAWLAVMVDSPGSGVHVEQVGTGFDAVAAAGGGVPGEDGVARHRASGAPNEPVRARASRAFVVGDAAGGSRARSASTLIGSARASAARMFRPPRPGRHR